VTGVPDKTKKMRVENYIKVYNWMITEYGDVLQGKKLLLYALIYEYDRKGGMTASIAFISSALNISARYAKQLINELVEDSMITREQIKTGNRVEITRYKTVVHGEPQLTTGRGELENTTGHGEPQLTTHGEPQFTTHGEPQFTTPPILDNIIYNNSQRNARTRGKTGKNDAEKGYQNDLEKDDITWEQLAMRFKRPPEQLKKKLADFTIECATKTVTHQDRRDYRSHFVDWLRIQIEKEDRYGNTNQGNHSLTSKQRANKAVMDDYERYVAETEERNRSLHDAVPDP
jgi:hypothetical protein